MGTNVLAIHRLNRDPDNVDLFLDAQLFAQHTTLQTESLGYFRIPSPGRAAGIAGDLNHDGVIDERDLTTLCSAIASGNMAFDFDGSGRVDTSDVRIYVQQGLGTSVGDANFDGRFDSGDFVGVFQVGEYEGSIAVNSTWAEGDWNCDSDF